MKEMAERKLSRRLPVSQPTEPKHWELNALSDPDQSNWTSRVLDPPTKSRGKTWHRLCEWHQHDMSGSTVTQSSVLCVSWGTLVLSCCPWNVACFPACQTTSQLHRSRSKSYTYEQRTSVTSLMLKHINTRNTLHKLSSLLLLLLLPCYLDDFTVMAALYASCNEEELLPFYYYG